MALNHTHALPLVLRHALPEADRLVVRARREETAVRREREGPDCRCVPHQREEAEPVFGGVVDVELDRVVVRR